MSLFLHSKSVLLNFVKSVDSICGLFSFPPQATLSTRHKTEIQSTFETGIKPFQLVLLKQQTQIHKRSTTFLCFVRQWPPLLPKAIDRLQLSEAEFNILSCARSSNHE